MLQKRTRTIWLLSKNFNYRTRPINYKLPFMRYFVIRWEASLLRNLTRNKNKFTKLKRNWTWMMWMMRMIKLNYCLMSSRINCSKLNSRKNLVVNNNSKIRIVIVIWFSLMIRALRVIIRANTRMSRIWWIMYWIR